MAYCSVENPLLHLAGVFDDAFTLSSPFTGNETTVSDFKKIITRMQQQPSQPSQPVSLIQTPVNIIFLDIDGVCWPESKKDWEIEKFFSLKHNDELCNELKQHDSLFKRCINRDYECMLKIACWSAKNMERIRELCLEFNAKIVVSSAWREIGDVHHLQNMFDLWGLRDYIIDKTTVIGYGQRPLEIQEWVDRHPALIKKYIIVDDDFETELTTKFDKNFIHCDKYQGFDDGVYKRAHAFFN